MPRRKKQVKRQHATAEPHETKTSSVPTTTNNHFLEESDSDTQDPPPKQSTTKTTNTMDEDNGSEHLPSSSSEEEPDNPDDESFLQEEEASSSNSDDDDDEPPQRGRRRAVSPQKVRSSASRIDTRRKSVLEWSEAEENAFDDTSKEEATFSDSSDDEGKALVKSNSRKRQGRKPTAKKVATSKRSTKRNARATARRPAQRKPASKKDIDFSSEEDDNHSRDSNSDAQSTLATPTRSMMGRTQRSSAQKARIGIVQHTKADMRESSSESEREDEDDDGDAGDNDDAGKSTRRRSPRKSLAMLQPKKKRNKKKVDDDEDFIADSEEDEDDEMSDDDPVDGSEIDEEIVGTPDSSSDEEDVGKKHARNNVDEEVIGTQDDSSSDEERTSPRSSTELEITPIKRHRDRHSMVTSSSSQESPGLPDCPSTEDAITTEKLPKRHVCFISRSGNRQCFDLLTLRKIATSSALRPTRETLDGSHKATYLQPPHFRTPMDDDLLDQIASRFGREALDLKGPYYCQPVDSSDGQNSNQDDDIIEIDDGGGDGNGDNQEFTSNENFLDLVGKYARSQMGSQDLYVCPLCFCVAQDRFIRENYFTKSRKKVLTKNDPESLRSTFLLEKDLQDPIAVLRDLDKSYHRELEIASTFCSTKVSSLKAHIREDHGLDTKGIEGNTLYARYKIRVQDGILQRYLFNTRGNLTQGIMSQYWHVGNNLDFIHLLYLVERAKIYAEMYSDEESSRVNEQQRKEAKKYWKRAQNFFDSFEDIKEGLWDLLTQPHRKYSGDDMNEFIADDNEASENDDDGGANHRSMEMESIRQREAQERAEDLEKVRRFQAQVLGEDQSSESIVNETDEEEAHFTQIDESSDDDWEKNLLKKRRKSKSPNLVTNKRRRAQQNLKAKDESESEEDFLEVSSSSGTSHAKTQSFDDTDDDDGPTANTSPRKVGRVKKLKILDDDDEE